jgi:F-type H+-transporting ATPase subunit b
LKEIVKQIMETETEVREAVEKARAEAQKIVREAETDSRDIIEKGRQQAIRESQELVERCRRDAEAERKRQVDAVKGGSEELLASKAARIESAAAKVLDMVKGDS